MSALYFDATYLCKLYWQERGSREVAACVAGADEIVVAAHGRAEFYSAGHRKLREGATVDAVQWVFTQFDQARAAGKLRVLPLSDAVFERLENVYSFAPASTFLRAGDALHLACAAEHGFTEAYSNDRHFLAAAPLFGLGGLNVIPAAEGGP